MKTTSIRVEEQTHAKLAELSERQHRPMAKIVAEAVAKYDEDLFWAAVDEAYDRMNADRRIGPHSTRRLQPGTSR